MAKQIKIGPVTYAVELVDGLRAEDGRWLLGEIHYSMGVIKLDSGMPEDVARVVLMHEILHGILTHAGFEHSEELVDCLAYGINQLIGDNPGLIRKWVRDASGGK